MQRMAFYISDSTGITAETVGHALLSRFDRVKFQQFSVPFINSSEKLAEAVQRINRMGTHSESRPLVFSTLTDPDLAQQLSQDCDALILDLFGAFVKPIEDELHQESSYVTGRSHSLSDQKSYDTRMDVVNFSLNHDDGASIQHLSESEVIIIGVSRSGKTPTSVYMAMQFGIRAANSPLTEDELETSYLPKYLKQFQKRIYGLTIDPARLQQIRQQRRPDSPYSSLSQCRKEVQCAEELFQNERIPFLNTTERSIEEIASQIIDDMNLTRRYY